MTFSFSVTNADSSRPGVNYSEYKLTKYFDKYGSLDMTLAPGSSVSENSTIEASYRGTIRFRGYIDYPEVQDDNSLKFTSYEQQRLLEYRGLQIYQYPTGTTFSNIISSSTPGTVAGLLYLANSLIPQGSFIQYSGNVYYLRDYLNRGAGTSSVFGTISSVYQGATALTHGASAALSAGQWYQSANELYVRTTDDKDPRYWNISVPNFKDTLLRVGDIESGLSTETLAVPYRISKGTVDKEIERLIDAFGFEYQWRHSLDGYTYLDIKTTVGRGSSTKGVSAYKESGNIFGLDRQLTGNPKIAALLGAGSGSGATQQVAAELDLYNNGVWKEEIYSDSNMFSEELDSALTKIFPDKREPLCYEIDTEIDPALNCGDYIDIFPLKYSPVTKRVKKISYSHDGSMKVEAGVRMLSPSDVIKAKFTLLESFSNMANSYLNSWNFNFNCDSITNTVPYSVKFKVQTDEIDSEYPYRFMLNVNLDWYKSTVESNTTPSHRHSGITGSGGGASHGNSGSGGVHTNPISSHTASASGSYDYFAGDAHSHTVTVRSSSSHTHTISVSGSWYYTTGGGDHEHAAYGPSGGGSAGYSGGHSHSTGISAPGDITAASHPSHTHVVPSMNTGNSSTHADHLTTPNLAHTLPMVSEADTPDVVSYYKKELSTGSIKYLTVTIKCNGTNVDGSPFADYYPGDSISDIDITDQISLSAENTIQISIAQYGGSGSVRCSANGSVSSKYYITDL